MVNSNYDINRSNVSSASIGQDNKDVKAQKAVSNGRTFSQTITGAVQTIAEKISNLFKSIRSESKTDNKVDKASVKPESLKLQTLKQSLQADSPTLRLDPKYEKLKPLLILGKDDKVREEPPPIDKRASVHDAQVVAINGFNTEFNNFVNKDLKNEKQFKPFSDANDQFKQILGDLKSLGQHFSTMNDQRMMDVEVILAQATRNLEKNNPLDEKFKEMQTSFQQIQDLLDDMKKELNDKKMS